MNKYIVPVNEPYLFGKEKKYLLKCLTDGFVSSSGKFVREFEKKFAKKKNSNLKKIILSKGDLVETSKNERHAIRAIKDSEFLVFTQGPRSGKEYEKDTFRLLKPLIK